MELPPQIRAAVDQALEGVALADLRAAAECLSKRYRDETRDGRAHLSDDLAARAYLAVRMPATGGGAPSGSCTGKFARCRSRTRHRGIRGTGLLAEPVGGNADREQRGDSRDG
jgi:hypothetical protein